MEAPEMLIIFSALFFLHLLAYTNAEQYIPVSVDIPEHAKKVFSPEEISYFDGREPDQPLYMGVKGLVFDVSSGKDFYGKGAAYNALVGKDCTRAVAKMSLEPEDLTHDVSGLSESALKSLDQTFKGTYLKKYPVVGIMDYLAKQNAIHEHLNTDPMTEEKLHGHHKDDL